MTNESASKVRMECRICWHVYDPEEGDELGQIAPGTAFNDLPAEWCCPECDAARHYYLVCD
ncbi:MAG: rubredoxin [Thiohalocapsa sp.]